MAHAAKLNQLADCLITSTTGRTSADADFKRFHDRAARGVKDTSHSRTNQFDVQAKLEGLVEKFAVRDRDDLAEGLQIRLDELPAQSKWQPEILSLLLQLSDRPLEKIRIEDVEAASKVQDDQPALTWQDILADDPLDDSGIWDDVERGYHSSDDDFTADEGDSSDETQATSIVEDDPVALARMHVLQVDNEALDQVKDAHNRFETASTGAVLSELTLIRESLSMLHGLPTSVYDLYEASGHVTMLDEVKMHTTSNTVLTHARQQMAVIGTALNELRMWAKSKQEAPTLRSCQSALAFELKALGLRLAELEQRYVTPKQGAVASLAELQTDAERLAQPFRVLARVFQDQKCGSTNVVTVLLDKLYDQACCTQLSGDHHSFETVSRILLAGLHACLRPVARWITAGKLDGSSDFFVADNDPSCVLSRLWHERYALRRHNDGKVAAPSFLSPFVDRIFSLGKGRAFLQALDGSDAVTVDKFTPPPLDLQIYCNNLLPFSQILQDGIGQWILDQSKDQTPLLRKAILHDRSLLQLPEILQNIFFSKNGRRFQTFADTLFWRLDHGTRWEDTFLLTELAQSTLGNGDGIQAESIAVQVASEDHCNDAFTSIRQLEAIQLSYHVSWPLQNITASASSPTYTKAFTLLLRTYRAKYLLRQRIFHVRQLDSQTSHLSAQVQKTLRLDQKLSTVVDIFHTHITHTSEVLSLSLRQALEQAEDIDVMAALWRDHEARLEMSLLHAEKQRPVREAIVEGLLEGCEKLMGMFGQLIKESGKEAGEGDENDDDDDGEEEFDVRVLEKEVGKSLSFITAGLRGIGRAGGNTALEQLAERLEWAVH